METILVTGAAGFIGSHTVDCLLDHGFAVVGIDNLRTGKRQNLASALDRPGFNFREGDVTKPGAMDSLLEGRQIDAIIHLAALVSVAESIADPDLNFRLNLYATHAVAAAACRNGVNKLVFASSAAVYGPDVPMPVDEGSEHRPISPYGMAKSASESLLFSYARSFGITVHCLRYFNVYGPRQDKASSYSGVVSVFSEAFERKRLIRIFGDGTQTRDFISVHDVARANLIAATTPGLPGGAVNICTGKGTSLLRLIDILSGHYAAAPSTAYEAPRAKDILHSVGNPQKAAAELRFRPRFSIESGLSQAISFVAERSLYPAWGSPVSLSPSA